MFSKEIFEDSLKVGVFLGFRHTQSLVSLSVSVAESAPSKASVYARNVTLREIFAPEKDWTALLHFVRNYSSTTE